MYGATISLCSPKPMPVKPPRPELLELDHRIEQVGAGAAVFLGQRHAQEAVRAGLVPHLAVDVALLFPGLVEGRDLLVHEAAEAVAEGLVVGAEEGAFDHASRPGKTGRRFCRKALTPSPNSGRFSSSRWRSLS